MAFGRAGGWALPEFAAAAPAAHPALILCVRHYPKRRAGSRHGAMGGGSEDV